MNMWNYSETVELPGEGIDGYDVEASDGSIGTVDSASHEPDNSYLVVDTGFWIFGKRRLVPAGVVRQVNPAARKVFLSVDKNAVKSAPDYDEVRAHDPALRDEYAAPFVAPKL